MIFSGLSRQHCTDYILLGRIEYRLTVHQIDIVHLDFKLNNLRKQPLKVNFNPSHYYKRYFDNAVI